MFINVFNHGCLKFYEEESARRDARRDEVNYMFTLLKARNHEWIEVNLVGEKK